MPSNFLSFTNFQIILLNCYIDEQCADVFTFWFQRPLGIPLSLGSFLEGIGDVVVEDEYFVESV